MGLMDSPNSLRAYSTCGGTSGYTVLVITDECDQRCKHCYIYSSGKHTCLKSMTWEEMENTFYNCLDFCKVYGMTPYFYITGGDPILHPDFWRLLDLCHEHDIKFTILGNPFHLNDQVCRELKWYGCEKYQLSLDGLRETHDWFRKCSKVW